jgi:hypothetical protein
LADTIEPGDLQGRRILIGITRVAADGGYAQEQHVGIAGIHDRGTYCLVTIECDDGETREYPFDSRTLQRARPGEYRMRSTGQVVANPDFLMTWVVTKD